MNKFWMAETVLKLTVELALASIEADDELSFVNALRYAVASKSYVNYPEWIGDVGSTITPLIDELRRLLHVGTLSSVPSLIRKYQPVLKALRASLNARKSTTVEEFNRRLQLYTSNAVENSMVGSLEESLRACRLEPAREVQIRSTNYSMKCTRAFTSQMAKDKYFLDNQLSYSLLRRDFILVGTDSEHMIEFRCCRYRNSEGNALRSCCNALMMDIVVLKRGLHFIYEEDLPEVHNHKLGLPPRGLSREMKEFLLTEYKRQYRSNKQMYELYLRHCEVLNLTPVFSAEQIRNFLQKKCPNYIEKERSEDFQLYCALSSSTNIYLLWKKLTVLRGCRPVGNDLQGRTDRDCRNWQ